MSEWCPVEMGFKLLSADGPCVKFHTDKMTWYEANQTCASYTKHSRLVMVDTAQKDDLVRAEGLVMDGNNELGESTEQNITEFYLS